MKEFIAVVLFLGFSTTKVASQSLPCRTVNGDNCPSVICPNTVVNYTCTITNGTAAGNTDWILPTGTCPTNPFPDKIRLSQLVSQQCSAQGSGGTPNMCGPYYRASSIQSSDPTLCLSSILTVNITSTMNGNTVTCSNTNLINPAISTAVSSATINVVASPGTPNVSVKTNGPDMLSVVISSSSSGGLLTVYNVTISNNSYINTIPVLADSNGSSMLNITGTRLANGCYYNVSVVTINCAGSSNATTQQVYFSWTSPSSSPLTSSTTPTASPTSKPTATSPSAPCVACTDTSTAVGVTFAITFILSFSLGGLVTAIIICGCYIPRVSSVTNEPVPPATTYEVVGINQKEINTIELESNAAYGTAR